MPPLSHLLGLLVAGLIAGAASSSPSTVQSSMLQSLARRDDSFATCSDLTVASNGGNRRVAIVIDSSESMQTNDPQNYRISAARALNNFLLPGSDLVAVIHFAAGPFISFPLGNPGDADGSISQIGSDDSGTEIYTGVDAAIEQLTAGAADISQRSALVLFTDGQDSFTDELVASLANATEYGIRVSFGFLSTDSQQDVRILAAIQRTGGVYATIADTAGSPNFINFVLINGLTYKDNPHGSDTRLFAGLGQTYNATDSGGLALQYPVQQGENFNFSCQAVAPFAGTVAGDATLNGNTISSIDLTGFLSGTSPSAGVVTLQVQYSDDDSTGSLSQSLFSVLTFSDKPFENCTAAVVGAGGLSSGAKAGIGIGTVLAVGLLAAGGFFIYKYLHVSAAATGGAHLAAAGHAGGGATQVLVGGAEKGGLATQVASLHAAPSGGSAVYGTGASTANTSLGPGMHPGMHPAFASPGASTGAVGPAGAYPSTIAAGSPATSIVPPYSPMPDALLYGGAAPAAVLAAGGALYQPPHQQPISPQQTGNSGPAYQQPVSPQTTGGSLVHYGQPMPSHVPDGAATLAPPDLPPHGTAYAGYSSPTAQPFYTPPMSTDNGSHPGIARPPSVSPEDSPLGIGAVPVPLAQQATHHHHDWLHPAEACADPQCPLIDPAHLCTQQWQCPCTCRDPHCPLLRG